MKGEFFSFHCHSLFLNSNPLLLPCISVTTRTEGRNEKRRGEEERRRRLLRDFPEQTEGTTPLGQGGAVSGGVGGGLSPKKPAKDNAVDFGFLVATSHVETAFYFSSGGVTDMPLVGLPRERGRLRLHLRLRFFFTGACGVDVDKTGLTRLDMGVAAVGFFYGSTFFAAVGVRTATLRMGVALVAGASRRGRDGNGRGWDGVRGGKQGECPFSPLVALMSDTPHLNHRLTAAC